MEHVPPPQETTVKFEVNGQPINLEISEIKNLFADINKYNKQFSLGSMMSRVILSHFEPNMSSEKEDEDNIASASLSEEDSNQQITAFFLNSRYRETLNSIGLSLEPVAGGAIIAGEGATASQGEIAIHVQNKDSFISFLGALQPTQIEASGLKSYLEKIPGVLSQQILTKYDLVSPEAEAIELFGGMEAIIEQYKRLGMSDIVSGFEEYYHHGISGDLREYVAIERKGLLSPPGKYFGPADWQIDSNPDSLERRWNEAIAILDVAKQNPKAAELYQKLHDHLSMCVDLALQSLPTLDYIKDRREVYKTILEVAQQKLSMSSSTS